jgi:hypothetical protein
MRAWSLLFLVGVAQAQPRVAVVAFKYRDIGADERAKMREAIERAAVQVGLAPVDVLEASQPELVRCIGEIRCQSDLGARLDAELLLTGNVAREDGAWVGAIMVVDPALGTGGQVRQVVCPGCSATEFAARLGATAQRLLAAARDLPKGTLAVVTRPKAVEVRVDGRFFGSSDCDGVVAGGTHVVSLGGRVRLIVEVKPGERRVVEATMPELVEPMPSAPAGRPFLVGGGIVVAAGVLSIGAGIGALAVDGDGTCALSPPQRQCAALYTTTGLGGALLGAGLAAAIAGTVVLSIGAKRARIR